MEVEPGSGDVTAAGASDVNVPADDDNDDVDDDGKMQPHHFDKNIYTFSAASGRALQQQQQTSNIKNLV